MRLEALGEGKLLYSLVLVLSLKGFQLPPGVGGPIVMVFKIRVVNMTAFLYLPCSISPEKDKATKQHRNFL